MIGSLIEGDRFIGLFWQAYLWVQDEWFYSLDFNEKCADVQYVLDFLTRIRDQRGEALDRVQYIEQPTHRDLKANPENQMHEAAKLKLWSSTSRWLITMPCSSVANRAILAWPSKPARGTPKLC